MKILLDTHVWLWYLLGDERLSPRLRREIAKEKNELWLSPISLWESAMLAEAGRVKLFPTPESWLERQLRVLETREAPVTNDVALLSRRLGFNHADPADRFIVATAVAMNLKLATADARLQELPFVESVW